MTSVIIDGLYAVSKMTTATLPITPAMLSPSSLLASAAAGKASFVRISVDQYHKMIDTGILPEDASVELLHGMLVRKDRSTIGEDPLGQSPLHRQAIVKLTALVPRIQTATRQLQIQLPIVVSPDHEPEPDGAVILGAYEDFSTRLPTAAEVSCVIEVAHSSLERDEEDKLPIYASAGISQYLIVNLRTGTVEEYTEPDPFSGRYRTKATFSPGEVVSLGLGGSETLKVDAAELLP